LWGLA